MDPQPERLALVEQPEPLSIAALYRQVQAAVTGVVPRGHLQWVRGEIQSISDRTGHCYMDLVDPDAVRGRDTPVLKVNCWGRTWGPLKTTLGRQGIVLEPGVVVSLRGRVEFYPPRGQINFIASDVDVTALLGRLAARRAALLHTLESEGLLRRNQALAVPAVPLRIGLVASPGSEGYNDFVGQLRRSDLAFSVVLFKANVQGAGAPASVARALHAMSGADCDLAVLVRGGGSRGDLAAFDAEPVARAIAGLALPAVDGDRAHGGPVRGRHRRQPRLRHADGVCARARPPSAGVVGVGGPLERAHRPVARSMHSRPLRVATAPHDGGWAPPLGTSCRGTPNAWSTGWCRSPQTPGASWRWRGSRWSGGRRASVLAPSTFSTASRTRQDHGDGCSPPTTSSASSNGATPSPWGPTVASSARCPSSTRAPNSTTRFADGRATSTVSGTETRSTTEGQR